jgi:hypothetical protein
MDNLPVHYAEIAKTLTAQAGINTLPTFTSSNFTAVPFENEPTLGLVILGVAYTVRRRLKYLVKK